jgi:hypothetical protein
MIMLPCTLYVHNMRRYQAVGEKLAVENFSLTDELAKQKLTLQDINEFLTNELKARSLAAAQASADTASRAPASSRCTTGNAATRTSKLNTPLSRLHSASSCMAFMKPCDVPHALTCC